MRKKKKNKRKWKKKWKKKNGSGRRGKTGNNEKKNNFLKFYIKY